MQKEIIKAKDGFEDIFENLQNKINEIEIAKQNEKDLANAEIDQKFEVRLSDYNRTLETISIKEMIEVPDEECEQVEEEVACEEQHNEETPMGV